MKPRFDNKGMNTLYYCLMWCSAIAAGLALVFYKSGKISLAAVVAICVLFAFFALFDMGWNFLSKKENASIIDESAADEGTSEPDFDINEAKAARTPLRVFLSLLTVIILLIAWGWAWSQHTFDGVFFMDKPVSTYLWSTAITLGLMLYARFPFLMDEDRYKNMAQVNLAINSKLVTALFLALAILAYAVLKNNPGATPWETIAMLILGFVWLDFIMNYLDKHKDAGNPQAAQEASAVVNVLGMKVSRGVVLKVIKAVIIIVLVAAWTIKLTAGGLGVKGIYQPTLMGLAFTLVSLGFLVASHFPGWFLSRANGRHIASFVINQLCIATVFALFALETGLQEGLNWNPSNHFITIAGIVVFLAAGLFFGGLDKSDKKKNK